MIPKLKTSQCGLDLIKRHEGLRLTSYLCPAGKWTVGYGHTRTAAPDLTITEHQAEDLLRSDLEVAEAAVNARVRCGQNQFDALVSFVFNVGTGNFFKSTLLRMIDEGERDDIVANEFSRWVYAKGKKLPGLVKRRADEAALYVTK